MTIPSAATHQQRGKRLPGPEETTSWDRAQGQCDRALLFIDASAAIPQRLDLFDPIEARGDVNFEIDDFRPLDLEKAAAISETDRMQSRQRATDRAEGVR